MNMWEDSKKLRKIKEDISGCNYSEKYFQLHFKDGDECSSGWNKDSIISRWVEEPVEVMTDNNDTIFYRFMKEKTYSHSIRTEYKTSAGNFVTRNFGEFGGILNTAKNYIKGNFITVFEFGNYIYAIDSLAHMVSVHTNIYRFDHELNYKAIFKTKQYGMIIKEVLYRGMCFHNDKLYILVSGEYSIFTSYWIPVTYLIITDKKGKIKIKKLLKKLDHVTNIVAVKNRLVIGRDKMVSVVNLWTRKITNYTPLDDEAINDIIAIKNQI